MDRLRERTIKAERHGDSYTYKYSNGTQREKNIDTRDTHIDIVVGHRDSSGTSRGRTFIGEGHRDSNATWRGKMSNRELFCVFWYL
jgi:hypothetical protein